MDSQVEASVTSVPGRLLPEGFCSNAVLVAISSVGVTAIVSMQLYYRMLKPEASFGYTVDLASVVSAAIVVAPWIYKYRREIGRKLNLLRGTLTPNSPVNDQGGLLPSDGASSDEEEGSATREGLQSGQEQLRENLRTASEIRNNISDLLAEIQSNSSTLTNVTGANSSLGNSRVSLVEACRDLINETNRLNRQRSTARSSSDYSSPSSREHSSITLNSDESTYPKSSGTSTGTLSSTTTYSSLEALLTEMGTSLMHHEVEQRTDVKDSQSSSSSAGPTTRTQVFRMTISDDNTDTASNSDHE